MVLLSAVIRSILFHLLFLTFSATHPAKQIKFMTYNVWSREDVVLYTRMQAIGRLVHDHSQDVIFFQEVTSYILQIFKSSAWLKRYYYYYYDNPDEPRGKIFCMMFSKFPIKSYKRNAVPAGAVYHEAYIDPDPATMKPVYIATTQLQCPIPPASMHFSERYWQAESLLAGHRGEKNVVIGGDMSWDDKANLPFPLPADWVDAACALGQRSWTYDAFWNEKAPEFNGCVDYESMKRRSDRFVCKLQDYELHSIQVIGGGPVGVDYRKKLEGIKFALRPSCHRGLVLTIVPK